MANDAKIQELLDAAYAAVPASGEIAYADLTAKLKAEGNERAIPMLGDLKRQGKLKAALSFVDGKVIHTYRRTVGGV